MNSEGIQLIEELYTDSSKFYKQGKSYQLLQKYFEGFPLESLRPLLSSKDTLIRKVAIWIISELGTDGCFINDIIPLVNDEDRYIKYHALEIIAMCSTNKNNGEFIILFPHLESTDDVIRILTMRLISNANMLQLEMSAKYFGLKETYNKLHLEGLLKLIEIDSITYEQVLMMINSDEPLSRKYGVIAAKRLYNRYPDLINEAMISDDQDIVKFSKEVAEMHSI